MLSSSLSASRNNSEVVFPVHFRVPDVSVIGRTWKVLNQSAVSNQQVTITIKYINRCPDHPSVYFVRQDFFLIRPSSRNVSRGFKVCSFNPFVCMRLFSFTLCLRVHPFLCSGLRGDDAESGPCTSLTGQSVQSSESESDV